MSAASRSLAELADQIRVLSSPVRQEIVDVLSSEDPLSIGEVATIIGRNPTSLYFHFGELLEAELISEFGQRPTGRTAEMLFTSPRYMSVLYDLASESSKEAVLTLSKSMLRVAQRDFEKALTLEYARSTEPGRNLKTSRWVARLTKQEQKHVNALFEEIISVFAKRRGSPKGVPVSLMYSMAPLPENDRGNNQPRKPLPSHKRSKLSATAST